MIDTLQRLYIIDGLNKQMEKVMNNLLTETKEILKDNGKNIFDILWYGTKDFVVSSDIQKLFDFEYDDGYGIEEIPLGLLLVGEDFWLERHEYDGSEWWEYKCIPTKPTQVKEIGVGKLQIDRGW